MISPVISKIISMQQTFTVSESEIAQYVINNANTVVTSTITTLAQKTGTSEASINRFCKKIGYKGFNNFKVALVQENFFNSIKTEEPATSNSLVAAINRDYNHMLLNTTALLDEGQVLQVAEAMRRVAHIYIFSHPRTKLIAQDLENRLYMIGIYAKAVTDVNEAQIYVNNITKDDFVFILSPTLLQRNIYHISTICRDIGAKVLAITSYDSPKLSHLIDYKFIISDKMSTHYSVSSSNTLMYLYITDVLYCALLEGSKTLKQRRINSDSILNNR